MNSLSAIRILRVPRHGSHFFALSSNNSLLPVSTTTFFIILFRRNQIPHAWCHVLQPGVHTRRTYTPLLPIIQFP
jgi:hypothetical protein